MEIVGEAGEIEVLVEAARGHTNEQIGLLDVEAGG
jgi:hypothetical protein